MLALSFADTICEVTGAKEPGPRGERDISRKTIAWGMPDVSGASAVNTRVHTPTTKRTRGCGCIGHPAFPAPSPAKRYARLRAHRAARARSYVWQKNLGSRKKISVVVARACGRSSIPETSMMEPRGRGVMDPRMRGVEQAGR